ncbi:MAG: EFR1 family ferrodoxin, partial [archaeon]
MVSKEIKDSKSGIAYYFSGTGNTAYVIDSWCTYFKQNKINIEKQKIEDILTVTSQKDYDFLVIGFPVYAWYPPSFVIDFLEQLPNVEKKKVIIIGVCAGQSGSSLPVARRILEKKNYDIIGTFAYNMPSNASYMFNKDVDKEEVIENRVKLTDEKINIDFNLIFSGQRKISNRNIFLRTLHSSIHWGFSKQLKKPQWVVDKD